MRPVKLARTKHGITGRSSRDKPRYREDRAKKRFPGRLLDDRMKEVEAGVRKEMEAERRAERSKKPKEAKAGAEPEETGPDLLTLLRPVGIVHHAVLGDVIDDEYGD